MKSNLSSVGQPPLIVDHSKPGKIKEIELSSSPEDYTDQEKI